MICSGDEGSIQTVLQEGVIPAPVSVTANGTARASPAGVGEGDSPIWGFSIGPISDAIETLGNSCGVWGFNFGV